MKRLFNMQDFALDKGVMAKNPLVEVIISFIYPDFHQFLEFKPKQRIKMIDGIFRENLRKLLATNLFDKFSVNEVKKRPISVSAKVKLTLLPELGKLDYVSVRIESIESIEKIIKPETQTHEQFYCVKMTVVIEYEGVKSRKQDIEKRFVLIKAKSSDEAYEKIEAKKDDYMEPYLNPYGRLVRWRIDSLDDCYVTNVFDASEFNDPEGVEIYSKLSSRKSKGKAV